MFNSKVLKSEKIESQIQDQIIQPGRHRKIQSPNPNVVLLPYGC